MGIYNQNAVTLGGDEPMVSNMGTACIIHYNNPYYNVQIVVNVFDRKFPCTAGGVECGGYRGLSWAMGTGLLFVASVV